jgi:hypothetical protein
MHAPNNRDTKCVMPKQMKMKEVDKFTIIFGDFCIIVSTIGRATKQKTSKDSTTLSMDRIS